MKISKLIEILDRAKKDYGDVDVLVNDEEGDMVLAKCVFRQYPYDTNYTMNRSDPVSAIAIANLCFEIDVIGSD